MWHFGSDIDLDPDTRHRKIYIEFHYPMRSLTDKILAPLIKRIVEKRGLTYYFPDKYSLLSHIWKENKSNAR